MPKLELTYFDMHGGRGEVARMALSMASIPFEDVRISFREFQQTRSSFPYNAIPILAVDGVVVAQSNGINRYAGKLAGLYPDDALQAALCDEVMDAVEDVAVKVQPTLFIEDEAEKKRARQALADGPISLYLDRLAYRLSERGKFAAVVEQRRGLVAESVRCVLTPKPLPPSKLQHSISSSLRVNVPVWLRYAAPPRRRRE